jgi:hypothetical protein
VLSFSPQFDIPQSDPQQQAKRMTITCHKCGEQGHKAMQCRKAEGVHDTFMHFLLRRTINEFIRIAKFKSLDTFNSVNSELNMNYSCGYWIPKCNRLFLVNLFDNNCECFLVE